MNEKNSIVFEHDFSQVSNREQAPLKWEYSFENNSILKFEAYSNLKFHSVTRIVFDKSINDDIDCLIYSKDLLIGEINGLDNKIVIEEYIRNPGRIDDEFGDDIKIIYYTIRSK